jgi:hypothetical protein
MQKFVEKLKLEVSDLLEDISLEPNKLSRSSRSLEVVRNSLFRLREYINGQPFASKDEEIHYFKNLAPSFYSGLFYYLKEYNIEFEKQHGSHERVESLLIYEKETTVKFYEYHQEFYKYYYEKDTHMDEVIFVRDRSENAMLDEVEVIMGPDFCVGCYWTARLLANEQLKIYLKRELELLRNPPSVPSGLNVADELEWTDSQTDLVELIYGLHLKGSFNKGNTDLKMIVGFFERHLGIKIRNYPILWQDIKRRKKAGTKYLDEMKDRLIQKMDE